MGKTILLYIILWYYIAHGLFLYANLQKIDEKMELLVNVDQTIRN